MAKKAKQVPKVPAPTSLVQTSEYERTIARLLGEMATIGQDAEAEVKHLLERAAVQIAERQQQILALSKAIETYATKHRDELTEDSKTVRVPGGGSLIWYTTPYAVELADKAETIVARLEKLKLDRFVRIKKEVNKEALLNEREAAGAVEGISFSRHEKFAIRPLGRTERIEHNLNTRRWKIVTSDETSLEQAA